MASTRRALQASGSQSSQDSQEVAQNAAREADRLLKEAQKRAKTDERQRRIKAALRRTDRCLGRGPCSDRRRSRGRHCLARAETAKRKKKKRYRLHH